MPAISMSGNDSLVLNNRPITDFADGNVVELTLPNEIANLKTGKNGNSMYALNASGRQTDVKIRVMRGSADDKFLNGLLAQQQNNFAGFALMVGQFIKRIGDGKGKILSDTYVLGGGIFTKMPEAKTSVEGETEASVTVYQMRFSNAPRVIG